MNDFDDIEDLRARNRAALGLSGLGACCARCAAAGMSGTCGSCSARGASFAGLAASVPGGVDVSMLPAVAITTSFPPVSTSWSPGSTVPTSREGPGWGELMLRHLVRPEVEVGGMRVAPYTAYSDWSTVANGLTLVAMASAAIWGVKKVTDYFLGGRR